MTKKFVAILLAAMMLVGVLPTLAVAEETFVFTDSAGREVEVPKNATRIAASGALAQMVLFALAPDSLVGLASEWSPEAEEFLGDYYTMPVLGQLYGSADLNLEELAVLDPQIIIDVGEAKKSVVEDMDGLQEQLGIPTVHIDASLSAFGDAYRTLGELLGIEERATELGDYCDMIYTRAEEIMSKVGDNKASMVYITGADGLNVIAQGSYHAEIIDMLLNNVAVVEDPSSKGTGNPVDMEQLMLWDPDYIVFSPESVYDAVGTDPLWQEMKAIADKTYVEVPFVPYNWMGFPPSVQRYLGIIWLTDLFYPDESGYELYDEIAKYFELFYHAELSQEQFDRLIAHSMLPAA